MPTPSTLNVMYPLSLQSLSDLQKITIRDKYNIIVGRGSNVGEKEQEIILFLRTSTTNLIHSAVILMTLSVAP